MVFALCTSSNFDWHSYKISWRYLEQVSSYRADTILWRTKFKEKNSNSINARVMVLALCMFSNVDWYLYEVAWRELEQIQVIERTSLCDRPRENNMSRLPREITKKYKCKNYGSCALHVICWLIFIWSFVKLAWTVFKLQSGHDFMTDRKSSKANNSKCIKERIMVLALCTLSNVDWYLYEVAWR